GQVVAGHAGLGRERPRRGAGGVVFSQAHDDEVRQVVLFLKLPELLQEDVHVFRIADFLATFRNAVLGTHVSDQARDSAFHTRGAVGLAHTGTVFAIAAVS